VFEGWCSDGKRVGLSREDLERETARFRVADDQVRRDHAISHILAGISNALRDDVIFFGDTALSRTHLIHARLSEDIDLIALGKRSETAERLTSAINNALLRTHGRLTWSPSFTSNDVEPAIIETPTGIAIRVQLLAKHSYEPWPTEIRGVEQRYADAPLAELIVPTIESFVGGRPLPGTSVERPETFMTFGHWQKKARLRQTPPTCSPSMGRPARDRENSCSSNRHARLNGRRLCLRRPI